MDTNSTRKKVELLAPAGDWPSLLSALDAGADSVYFGIKGINMRHLATNFDVLELPKIMAQIRAHQAKGYLTLNTLIMQDDLPKVDVILDAAKAASLDGVILWDLGVLARARQRGLAVHLSTQASVSNSVAIEAFVRLGVSRIVLARECTLADIRIFIESLRSAGIPCEIETFIHGAMCVSISGRCFLSYLSHGASANKGQCVQPCRREYDIIDKEKELSFVVGEDYILSPQDLCTIEFIDRLIESGVDSFKIEGRMRPPEYVGVVTACYRQAIDAYYDGVLTDALKNDLREKLTSVYNRGFSTGFYFGKPQNWQSTHLAHTHQKVYVGYVARVFSRIGVAEICVQNSEIKRGDTILFIGKSTPVQRMCIDEMQRFHVPVDVARRGEAVAVKVPFALRPRQKVFLWQKKEA